MIAQAIANDGKMMQPYLVKSMISEKGKTAYEGKPSLLSAVTSKKTADKITDAMREAAKRSCSYFPDSVGDKVDRYQIALKTGTAETGDQNNSNNLWVVSFAPAEDPQYVVVVNHAGAAQNRHGYELVSAVADIYDYLFRSYVG